MNFTKFKPSGWIVLFFALLLMFFVPGIMAQTSDIITPGRVNDLTRSGKDILIKAENCRILLQAYGPKLIRVRVSRDEFKPDLSYAVILKPSGTFTKLRKSDTEWTIGTDSLYILVDRKTASLSFRDLDGNTLCEDYTPFPVTWQGTSVTSYKKLAPGEKFIGLGEKTGPLDRRGNAYVNWNSDVPSYPSNQDPLYVTIPFYMGIHEHLVYGIFLDNSYRTRFDFAASSDDLYSDFSADNGELNYYFFGSGSVPAILRDYTSLTGRMSLPPYWSMGYQQCRWSYYPESEVLRIAETFREKKLPCDVIYLDIHYMDAYKIFTWNKERFPQPESMIRKLKDSGFHLVTIVDPGIKVEKGYPAYEEGIKNDLFIKYPDHSLYTGSVWPGRCHFPDFTNPMTREWWGTKFAALTDPGVEGFWNDMNEPSAWGQHIPDILQFNLDGKGGTMAGCHNIYALEMSRSTFEGTKKLMNGRRPLILSRAGYAGIQRYSALWTGDNAATEEHLIMGTRLVNDLGLSGVSFVGSDVGGFMGDPTKELFARWMSIGVFTPFYRGHSEYNSRNHEPWAFGEDIEALSRNCLNLRYQLLPYLYSAFYLSAQNGMPVSRSLAIGNTFDEKIYWRIYQNEFMFGDYFLVAPVTSDKQVCKVYLPAGEWYRFSSGEKYKGNTEVTVDAPIENLPVFVHGPAIIPMQSVIQNTAQKPSPVLEIHIYNGPEKTTFTYYEDDGLTYNDEKGEFCKRFISFDPDKKSIIFSKKEGSFPSKFSTLRLIFHDFGDLMGIKVDGEMKTLKLSGKNARFVDVGFEDKEISVDF